MADYTAKISPFAKLQAEKLATKLERKHPTPEQATSFKSALESTLSPHASLTPEEQQLWKELSQEPTQPQYTPPSSPTLSTQRGLTHPTPPTEAFTPPGSNASKKELAAWEAAKEVEVNFVSKFIEPLIQQSQATVDESHGNAMENMLTPHLVQSYATQIVETGGTGLARDVYKELVRREEVSIQDPDKEADKSLQRNINKKHYKGKNA